MKYFVFLITILALAAGGYIIANNKKEEPFLISGRVEVADRLLKTATAANVSCSVVAKNEADVPIAIKRIINPSFPLEFSIDKNDLDVFFTNSSIITHSNMFIKLAQRFKETLAKGAFMGTFNQQVYNIVERIPKGKVASYGQIARMLGHPRGARQVGWAMSRCPEGLPWHRVVMADGSVSGNEYGYIRRELLADEGVSFLPDGRIDMKSYQWKEEA